jgi:hypothetical protein
MRTILKVAKYTRYDNRNEKKGRNKQNSLERDTKIKPPETKKVKINVKTMKENVYNPS